MTHARLLPMLALALSVPLLLATGAAQMTAKARDYVFVFINTGPATELTPEARQEAFAGHFTNMQRMASAGQLLIAGPMGNPKSSPDHRGIFVFDSEDMNTAMEWAHTDPTTKLGVFVLEGFRFTTHAPLTDLPRLDREDEAKRLADPDLPDEWEGRRYLLATAPYTEERLKVAANTEGVLIAGRLHASLPDGGDQVLVWLDAEVKPQADEILPTPDEWTLHGWYGSKMVAEMGR